MMPSDRDQTRKVSSAQPRRPQIPTTTKHRKAPSHKEQVHTPNPAPQQLHPDPSSRPQGSAPRVHRPDDSRALSIATILEIVKGTHPSSLVEEIISTAQSDLAQLKRTYDHLLNTPISSGDRDKIIKALQPQALVAQQDMYARIKAAHDQGFKSAQKAAEEIYGGSTRQKVQKARRQGYHFGVQAGQETIWQQHVQRIAHLEGVNNARSAEFAKKLKDIQELNAKHDAETSVQLGQSSAQLERSSALLEQSSMELERTSTQLDQCKGLFRNMIRARDAGDKHQLDALIAEADLADWLGLDGGEDEDEMHD